AKSKAKRQKETKPVEYEEEFRRVENDLAKKLGTKVSISRDIHKGKITIEYYSMEGLNRIIDIIKK
ncbi:MAG: chromosome partitioning protein ParB, partial [Clostridia bacterium]